MAGSIFKYKADGLRPATLLKTGSEQVFSCEFCKISKITFSYITHLVAASELRLLLHETFHISSNILTTASKE